MIGKYGTTSDHLPIAAEIKSEVFGSVCQPAGLNSFGVDDNGKQDFIFFTKYKRNQMMRFSVMHEYCRHDDGLPIVLLRGRKS